MNDLVLFAHGKESGPWGSKIRALDEIARNFGAATLSPDYSDLPDPDERVARLLAIDLPGHDRLVLVGSSMGGYASTVASKTLRPAGLFLMAPAFHLPGYAEQYPISGADETMVVFGRNDEVVPLGHGLRFAAANRCDILVIEGDHRLKDRIPTLTETFDRFLHRVLPAR